MPNHVTTLATVAGVKSDVQKFYDPCIVQIEGKTVFDFEQIIPMPKSLSIDCGTELEIGINYLLSQSSRSIDYKAPSWVACREVTEKAIELGRQALRNIADHGYATWYDWAVENWGTKWNSYSFKRIPCPFNEDSDFEDVMTYYKFKFDTAWSFPTPIFKKLAEMFPSLRFDTVCFDEGWNFAGRGLWKDGCGEFQELDATDDLYEEVYGYPPEKDEDDQ
jgi:hypothetical protein